MSNNIDITLAEPTAETPYAATITIDNATIHLEDPGITIRRTPDGTAIITLTIPATTGTIIYPDGATLTWPGDTPPPPS